MCLSVCLFVCLTVCPSVCLPACLSVRLSFAPMSRAKTAEQIEMTSGCRLVGTHVTTYEMEMHVPRWRHLAVGARRRCGLVSNDVAHSFVYLTAAGWRLVHISSCLGIVSSLVLTLQSLSALNSRDSRVCWPHQFASG